MWSDDELQHAPSEISFGREFGKKKVCAMRQPFQQFGVGAQQWTNNNDANKKRTLFLL